MTIYVPGWMQGGTYTAQQDRINSRAASFDEGVQDRTSFKVTQRAAGANMTVDVSAGVAIVTGDDQAFQGNYDVLSDATVSVSGFVATSANTRYDVVGIQINDPNAGGAAGNNAVLTRVAGTQAASPVIPTIPNSFLPLAIIGPFTTSTTAITNSMIHDAYTGTGPTGVAGMRLCAGFRDTPGVTKETYNPVAPNGWLIEDGRAVSRTTYAALFEHFGTAFGAGDGSTTFNLPDSRGRVLVALDNQGGTDAGRLTAANTLGGTGGAELTTISSTNLPPHGHSIDHDHAAATTSTESATHTHSGTTGDESNTHTHTSIFNDILRNTGGGLIVQNSASGYNYTPVSVQMGANNTGHTHAFSSGGQSANHTHSLDLPPYSGLSGDGAFANQAMTNMQPYIMGYRIVRT